MGAMPFKLPLQPPRVARPLFLSRVPAGFPSPADDYVEGALDLNEHLIAHREATFFVRVKGHSMTGAGIRDGDLLVVDRVSRRLMLRAGSAVVGLWNEAFDLDGKPPGDGTTVPGVQRVLKADSTSADARNGATP